MGRKMTTFASENDDICLKAKKSLKPLILLRFRGLRTTYVNIYVNICKWERNRLEGGSLSHIEEPKEPTEERGEGDYDHFT